MGLTSILLRLVAVGLIVGALYKVVSVVDGAISDHYTAPVKVEYERRLKVATDRADVAEKANESLRRSIDETNAKIEVCNARVDDMKKDSDDRTKISTAAIEAARAQVARNQSIIQALTDRALGPPTKGEFCDQAKEAYRILIDSATRQRVRDSTRP